MTAQGEQIISIQDKLTQAKKLAEGLGKSRELSLVITKIDEAILWLTAVVIIAEGK